MATENELEKKWQNLVYKINSAIEQVNEAYGGLVGELEIAITDATLTSTEILIIVERARQYFNSVYFNNTRIYECDYNYSIEEDALMFNIRWGCC